MSGWGGGWGDPWGGDVYPTTGAVPTVEIGGTNRPYLVVQSASISKPKRGRSTAQFTLFDIDQLYRPVIGSPVVLTDNGTTFRGIIMRIREQREMGIMAYVRYSVECSDYGAIFDRRLVSRTYPAASLVSAIYADVLQNFLLDEGFDVGGVDGFASIANELKFDYRSVTEVFDTISNLAGEDWWVGGVAGKTIYSKSLANSPAAPFGISDTTANWRGLEVVYDSRDYRNRQHVRAAVPLQSGAITENFTGNGVQWFFATQFVLNSAPTVTVGGVAQTIYQMGVDPYPAAGWFWIPGGGGVQEGTQTAVGNGVAVVVAYGSYESSVVTAESTAAQAARAAIEGGAGIWESIEDARDVDNIDIAEDLAQAILDRHSTLPVEIRYETDEPGVEPGQAQAVWLPDNGIDRVPSGTELVTDGGFPSATNWTLTTASISGGQLVIFGAGYAAQDIGIEAAKTYRVTFTLGSIAVGSMSVLLGGTTYGTSRTVAGTYTEDIEVLTISNAEVKIGGASFAGTINDLAVQEIVPQAFFVTQVDSRDAAGKPFSNGFYFRHRVTISSVRDQGDWLSWWLNFYRSTKNFGGGSAGSDIMTISYD